MNLITKLIVAMVLSTATPVAAWAASSAAIDREALVRRHNPGATRLDPLSPFSVGNGEFAFTADITGLQTFPEHYEKGIALHTESQWGWHRFPNPDGYGLDDVTKGLEGPGRQVPYASVQEGPAASYLRANPHRLDLGRIGLLLRNADGSAAQPEDLSKVKQTLDLWTGILTSEFQFDGQPVRVQTACHPALDLVAVAIVSPLASSGRLGVVIAFPGAKADWKDNADWEHPEAHQTSPAASGGRVDFRRTLDVDQYCVSAAWSHRGELGDRGPHSFEIRGNGGDRLGLVCAFSPSPIAGDLPDAPATLAASARHWRKFWTSGGALELAGSADPRAHELERRVVLSQYLTAIQCSGSMPPQETGLTLNSWFGKPHTEMHWWHAAHFALWGRAELLEKSLPWYEKIMPVARALAARQGYRGARWPKMVGPRGEESPSKVAPFLIWQQPHPIYYAELCYRARPSQETLKRYQDLVFQSAEFMASYARWNEDRKRFELGPPLIPAQECYEPMKTINPTFELAYWHWGLGVAQQWRGRLGMGREPGWDKVMANLSRPTVRDGVYTAIETAPYTQTRDHPSMLNAYGTLPLTPMIDPETMQRTYDSVLKTWQWRTTWGWDYPTLAMTAARLGHPDAAIDALFMDAQKNTYLPNGHNYQDNRLPLYLPGNGGLLFAVAMMAAGWDGAPRTHAPGFPDNGRWTVRWENLSPAP